MSWNEWYNLALIYAKEHNGSIESIEIKYITKNGYKLGKWVSRQRMAYKNRSSSNEKIINHCGVLTDMQVAKLESIGIVWSSWDKWYQLAKEYANEHNGSIADIKETYITDNDDELGIWVRNQRAAYKNRSLPKEKRINRHGVLTDEQVAKLESIDMVWDAKPDYNASWNRWYKLAENYVNSQNVYVSNMKETYITENNDKLGKWLRNQKTAYRNRSIPKEKRTYTCAPLTDERVAKLERIGIIWDIKKNKSQVVYICEVYSINFEKNKEILKVIPASLLQAKIDYCLKNDMPLTINGKLNEIFIMSGVNLYVKYGVKEKDLLDEYKLKMRG